MEQPRKDNPLLFLDWPPVWTAVAVTLSWLASLIMPWGILGGPGRVLGAVLVLVGVGMMLSAVLEMQKARTTVIPRRAASALVTSGIFKVSRNPIYLGDLLVAAGAILWFEVPWALPVVFVLAQTLRTRFIDAEERHLTETFGADFTLWAARTGRWFGKTAA